MKTHQIHSALPDSARRILDAAERLCAFHGIEGVSLREISREAGHKNNYAIQYYFKSKAGLLNAIFEDRYEVVQQRMTELLNGLHETSSPPPCRDLLAAIFLPLAELVNADGQRIHARFLLQFLTQFTPWEDVTIPADRHGDTSVMRSIWKYLRRRLPHIPAGLLRVRILTLTRMFLGALIEWENAKLRGDRVLSYDSLVNDLLDMATAALLARPQPSVKTAVRRAAILGLGD